MGYDENSRLTSAGSTAYKYDAANNPTQIGSSTYTYNEANEIEAGAGNKYAYDEVGQRITKSPTTGPATSYGYDQAGHLVSVTRAHEGETPAIADTYTYDGGGLRATETISGTTSYLAWDTSEELPVLLSEGTNSYIYGLGGLPIEQIKIHEGKEESRYLHHDQHGSTRLITGSTGTVEGKCSYGIYGTPTCEGSATASLGYDGQYTSSDTGLIYLRNRVYDPSTAQFLSVDPILALTLAPYGYAGDDPVNLADRTGLTSHEEGVPCYGFCAPAPSLPRAGKEALEKAEWLAKGVAEGAKESYEAVEGIFTQSKAEGESSNKNTQSDNGCAEIPRGAIDAEAALKQIAREHPDIPRGELGKALERAKKASGVPASGDTKIDPGTGEIYDAETGEQIGNVFD